MIDKGIIKEFYKEYEHSSLFECWDGCKKDLTNSLKKALKKQREGSLEHLLKQIKTGYLLSKTTKIKPMGFKGYEITIYEPDDITIDVEIRAKIMDELMSKLAFYLKK